MYELNILGYPEKKCFQSSCQFCGCASSNLSNKNKKQNFFNLTDKLDKINWTNTCTMLATDYLNDFELIYENKPQWTRYSQTIWLRYCRKNYNTCNGA